MNECDFCLEFSNINEYKFSSFYQLFPHLNDRILLETENFVVVPSFGQIVEGYLLIITKFHILSMGELSPQLHSELNGIIQYSTEIIQFAYNTGCIQFEHGAVTSKNTGGCCIDHAHLHLVPLNLKMSDIYDNFYFRMERYEAQNFPDSTKLLLNQNKPYLYIKIFSDFYFNPILLDATDLPSQYMRRIIAKLVGKPDEWDWAINIGKQRLENCLRNLKPLFNQKTKFL